MTESARVFLVSGDLLFGSRITAAGRDLGLMIEPCADLPGQESDEQNCAGLILDLTHSDCSIEKAAKFAAKPGRSGLAFGPHVDKALLDDAARAGLTALARSEFNRSLVDVLRRTFLTAEG